MILSRASIWLAVALLRPDAVRFHCASHFEDLKTIERLLVAGKLDEARSLAYELTKPVKDPGLAPYAEEAASLTAAATGLAEAPDVDTALRREALVATACAGCHVRAVQGPLFPPPLTTENVEASTASTAARHRWSADRLWEGIVSGEDPPWRSGLYVIAGTPMPGAGPYGAPEIAAQLEELARTQLLLLKCENLFERGLAYGEMLTTCAACHRALVGPPRCAVEEAP
jgi:mono/diheme cytochrome c family protein